MSVAEPPPRSLPAAAPRRRAPLARLAPETLLAFALGALMAAVALGAGGGLQLGRLTSVELGMEGVGGLLGALAVLSTRGRLHGALALALLAVLAGVTGLSIAWAVQPNDAWLEANRTLAYVAVFGAGIALVRMAPDRWGAVLLAMVIASTVVSTYALLTKVFPTALNPNETFARLREPFGYWNAVGVMAALGGPACLWLGSRRHGHAAANALAFSALGVQLVALLLAYSRGALLALGVGCALWFVTVPLRLRGAAVLGLSAVGALCVVAWVFGRDALTKDEATLSLRETAGHELGLLLVAMVLLLLVAGLAVGFLGATRAPGQLTRRRAGTAILIALALVPIGATVGLAFSEKGLAGSVSDGFSKLFDPNASAKASPSNDPGRLTAVGSVRARYFADSINLWEGRKLLGVGAGGFATARPRVRPDDLDVRHAHGYVFQTLADLGLLGSGVSLALLLAWLWAGLRAAALVRPRGAPKPVVDAELVALRTLFSIVVLFGVHSFVDWTWVIPGTAVPALLCAGFLAGRGPTRGAAGERVITPRARFHGLFEETPRIVTAVVLLAVTGAVAWASYQPQRSGDTADAGLAALDGGNAVRARALTLKAARIDPLAIEPLANLAVIEAGEGRIDAARAALQRAVQLQPQNPTPWVQLAEFDAAPGTLDLQGALAALRPALYLDPKNSNAVTLFLDVSRQLATPAATP